MTNRPTPHPASSRFPPLQPPAGDNVVWSPMRVLLVDPDVGMAAILGEVFRRHGHRLDAVCTIAAARAALDDHGHDAVLLELTLPDGSGLDLLRHIHTVRFTIFPVLVLSAMRQPACIARSLRLGAARHLTKPLDPREVVDVVGSLLEPAPSSRRPMLRAG